MKRLTWSLLTIAVCLLFSFGFASAERVTISYWSLFTGGDKDFMDYMVDQFMEENPDVFIEPLTAKWENYYDFFTTAIAGGNGPDVAVMHMNYIPAYSTMGLLSPLDPEMLEKYGIDGNDFLDVPWQTSTYGGVQYAIPLDVHTVVLFYNKAIIAEVGLLTDGSFVQPITRDGWLDVFATIKAKTNASPYTVGISTHIYREWFSLLYQNGGQLLTDDRQLAAFNSPEGIDALRFFVDHVKVHDYSPAGLTASDQTMTMFFNNDTVMEGYGAWRTGGYERVHGDNLGVQPYPTFGKQPAYWANSHVFVMPAQPRAMSEEKIEASMRFIRWMTEHGVLWARAGHIPSLKAVVESAEYQEMPNRPFRSADQLEYVRYAPPIIPIQEIEAVIYEELQAAFYTKTPEQAMRDAEQKVNNILRR